jgi:hypothetical protein
MSSPSEFTHSFFQASSEAWMMNKVRYGQASYAYKANAFPADPRLPAVPKQSRESARQTKKELGIRQALVDEAPLPVRKSPRLKEKHRQETYSMNCD